MRPLFAALIGLVLAAPGAHATSATYEIRPLGLMDGVTSARACGLNNNGEVVGWADRDACRYACYWNTAGQMFLLDTGSDDTQSGARKINDSGQIIGDGASGSSAVLWNTPSSAPIPLGPELAYTTDLTNSGLIIGTGLADGYCTGVVVRSPDGQLSHLDTDAFWSVVAVNELGIMAGTSGYPGRGFVRTTDGNLNWMQGDETSATDLNDVGQVTGTLRNGGGLYQAAVWDLSGNILRRLGPLQGFYHCMVYGINNEGTAVGYSMTPGSRACLWTAQSQLVDLGTLPGDTDSEAYAVNDHGWVVGISCSGATEHPVLWVPVPEPASILALITGLVGISGTALKRNKPSR